MLIVKKKKKESRGKRKEKKFVHRLLELKRDLLDRVVEPPRLSPISSIHLKFVFNNSSLDELDAEAGKKEEEEEEEERDRV